eukprot:1642550-Prymnesium_polylepis.1
MHCQLTPSPRRPPRSPETWCSDRTNQQRPGPGMAVVVCLYEVLQYVKGRRNFMIIKIWDLEH